MVPLFFLRTYVRKIYIFFNEKSEKEDGLMISFELILYVIVYGFEFGILALMGIGLFGFICGKFNNETLQAVHDFIFVIEDEELD